MLNDLLGISFVALSKQLQSGWSPYIAPLERNAPLLAPMVAIDAAEATGRDRVGGGGGAHIAVMCE